MNTFDAAKGFMEANVFTETSWPISSDEKYLTGKKHKNFPLKLEIISGH
jgi:hypothetical protein